MTVSAAMKDHCASNVTFLCPIWKITALDGRSQVEIATVAVDPIVEATSGDATVIVTAVGMAGSPKTVNAPIDAVHDNTSELVAAKIRAALAADASVAAFFSVGGVGTQVKLTAKTQAANDATMNISLANGTYNGLTPAPTSANTLSGIAGTVAAYCAHTRPLIFESVGYAVSAVEATRPMQKLGLSPNSIEINGVFDEIITQRGLEGGKWRRARVTYQIVNYLDLTMGSIGKIEGFIGKYTILNSIAYQLEFLSKSDALQPLLGELTSPIDRNSFPSGVNPSDFTFTGGVASVTNRKKFKVNYVQTKNNYFQYGVARFTSGNNNGLEMEIKESITTDSGTRTEIELQLDMMSDITIGDNLELVAGYDGTREQLRDKFSDMEDGNMEPDLPGLKSVMKYPE